MVRFVISVLLVISVIPLNAPAEINRPVAIIDQLDAIKYCDETPLYKIEGIWEFPSDQTRVLIRRRTPTSHTCDIVIISSADCRLIPGDIIGNIAPSGDPNRYALSLCRSRVKGVLTDPANCSAKLSSSANSISFTPRKFKISIGSLWFLPRFWRSIRIRSDKSNTEVQNGMLRVYPRASSPDAEPLYL